MKRKIAAVLSIMMVTASYAAPFVQAADDDKTLDGSSSVAYVDDTKVNVIVPTSASLNFTLDPQGLLYLGEKSNATLDEINAHSGRILGNGALIFANKSLKDVTATTTFKISDTTNNSLLYSGSETAPGVDDVKEDDSTKANLVFMAVPNKTVLQFDYDDDELGAESLTIADVNDESTFGDFSAVASDKGFVFKKSGTTIKTVIPGVKYNYTYDSTDKAFSYEIDENSKNSAVGFAIAGFCNPNYGTTTANYSNISVGVTASYSFKIASDDDKKATRITDTFAVIEAKDTANVTAIDAPEGVTTSISGTSSADKTPKLNDTTTDGTAAAVMNFSNVPADTTFNTGYLGVDYQGNTIDLGPSDIWAGSSINATTGKVTIGVPILNWFKEHGTNVSGKGYAVTIKDSADKTYTGYVKITS